MQGKIMKKLYDFLCDTQLDPNDPGRWYRVDSTQELADCLAELDVPGLELEPFTTTYNDYNVNKMALQFGLSVKEIKSWLFDPEYKKYSDNANSQIAVIPPAQEVKIRQILASLLDLDIDTMLMRVQVQAPGELIALHLDPLKTQLFNAESSEVCRYVWFLQDQYPGQVWLMDNQAIEWKANDLVFFDNAKLPHATANLGYHNRYCMIITGKKTKN
jgi:hypothetical protein